MHVHRLALRIMRLVLASASPARLATLRAAGVTPEVVVSGVDEDAVRAESVAELVLALASAKAGAVAGGLTGDAVVIGCDSLLELDGQPLGKPGDAGAARDRWLTMRGRQGVLHTGHALLRLGDGHVVGAAAETASTAVQFAEITDAEIDAYIGTGEPLAVAGAFTVDGLGGWFVEAIEATTTTWSGCRCRWCDACSDNSVSAWPTSCAVFHQKFA